MKPYIKGEKKKQGTKQFLTWIGGPEGSSSLSFGYQFCPHLGIQGCCSYPYLNLQNWYPFHERVPNFADFTTTTLKLGMKRGLEGQTKAQTTTVTLWNNFIK